MLHRLNVGRAALGPALAALLLAVPAQAAEYQVSMDNMTFGAMPKAAKVGDTIVWINHDTVQHSATANDGSFDVRLLPGKQARTVLTKAGQIAVKCIYHSAMRATLKVQPAG